MNKRMILGLLGLAFIAGLGLADDLAPIAVSPGLPGKTVVVRESCPTFSWTAVSWALTYRVVIFESAGEEAPAYENMAAAASPVLVKEIPGQALSWTPSADEQLLNGGSYFWYVGAMVNAAQGSWSEGRSFLVFEEPVRDLETEKRVMKTMRENGVGQDVAEKVRRDMNMELTEKAVSNFDLTVGSQNEVQGSEGASNTLYGLSAGASLTTGLRNAIFGRSAGNTVADGNDNTFMGYLAGRNTNASNNTFVGSSAGGKNSAGQNNAFLGFNSGYFNTTGYENTLLGSYAGYSNTVGVDNTFAGFESGYANVSGIGNNFFGDRSGRSNTTGRDNTFLGARSGFANTAGSYNTYVGNFAGRNSAGSENTFVGFNAGHENASNDNTFVGMESGYKNTSGIGNNFFGDRSGHENTTGRDNTFLGARSGFANTAGSNNTYVGNFAGRNGLTSSGNVFLGYYAGANETGSNKLYIDNSNTASPLIYGNFSTNILKFNGKVGIQKTPTHMLDVGTSGAYCDGGAWVDGSSREYKENIEELTTAEAQQAFEKLEPVKFQYKENKGETYLGFIAEDVPDLVAMNDRKGLNPMDMVAVLTKVVQEQQKSIIELREEIAQIKKEAQKEK